VVIILGPALIDPEELSFVAIESIQKEVKNGAMAHHLMETRVAPIT
jgi:hypothetical protein